MNAPLRQFASPFARKLARERGILLADVNGSGPAGRVVAADVLAFTRPSVAAERGVPPPPEAIAAPQPAPSPVIAAVATDIDFSGVQSLIEQFASAQLQISVDALLLRAAARSLGAVGIEGAIGWETGQNAHTVIAGSSTSSFGELQAQLRTRTGAADGNGIPGVLSIRRLKGPGIRAVAMPLKPDHQLRLVLSGNDSGIVDCLLCFNATDVNEDLAVEFLANFKENIETPLRLLA